MRFRCVIMSEWLMHFSMCFNMFWPETRSPRFLRYGKFIDGLYRGNMQLGRNTLCGLAETEPVTFKALVDEAKRIRFYEPTKVTEGARAHTYSRKKRYYSFSRYRYSSFYMLAAQIGLSNFSQSSLYQCIRLCFMYSVFKKYFGVVEIFSSVFSMKPARSVPVQVRDLSKIRPPSAAPSRSTSRT